MQVNRLIGSSNGHTLRPEEAEDTQQICANVSVVSKYVYTCRHASMCVCVCVFVGKLQDKLEAVGCRKQLIKV